jgi:hypothetical protein
MTLDPIPDPIAAGWLKEGDEPHSPAGTSLLIHDTTNAGFVRFYVEDPAAFTGEIELSPTVLLSSGFSVDVEDSTGVHVAINDGDRQIRADILETPAGGIRVAVKLLSGYSTGFLLPTPQAGFRLRRLADGSAVLAVAGQPPETVPRLQLALSRRPGFQTLEFGADNRGGVVSAEWYGLGLPALPGQTRFASLTVERLQLRVRA